MNILVIDVGSSSLRAAVVDAAGHLHHEHRIRTPRDVPAPGLAEFDPVAIASAAGAAAEAAMAAAPPVSAVGIANQRASTVVWDRRNGEPVGPGLSWQDLRTVIECLTLQSEGLRLAPNQPATKAAHLIAAAGDIPREELCVGTLDSWLVWNLTGGAHHVTDATNAAVTGLVHNDRVVWDPAVSERLGIPDESLPRIVDSSGLLAEASTLPGSPPIAGLVGDQQGALVGAGCVRPGDVKITFGTGGMLDVCMGPGEPPPAPRGPNGTFPVVAWQQAGLPVWGIEAMMLSAGSCVEWLRELGLLERPADSHTVAAGCEHSAGVVFVPALGGLGAPHWDFGARGVFSGLTMGVERAHLVRAVLEGVAHRGVDLIEAAEADSGHHLAEPVIDGGMSANGTFVQALADASGRRIRVAGELECTALGAAYLAGLAVGAWEGWDQVASLRAPRAVFEPRSPLDREQWRRALRSASSWHEDLSAVSF